MAYGLIPFECPPCDTEHKTTGAMIRNILTAVMDGEIQTVTRNGIVAGDCLLKYQDYLVTHTGTRAKGTRMKRSSECSAIEPAVTTVPA